MVRACHVNYNDDDQSEETEHLRQLDESIVSQNILPDYMKVALEASK